MDSDKHWSKTVNHEKSAEVIVGRNTEGPNNFIVFVTIN